MKTDSPYRLMPSPGSRCGSCGSPAKLLVDTAAPPRTTPAFYVCGCGYIGQVGVGPVKGAKCRLSRA